MCTKYIIKVTTNWCGMDQEYSAIANNIEELYDLADNLAYDNFASFDNEREVLEELFPEVEDDEYTEEQLKEASDAEHEYYGNCIDEYYEEDDDWENYELVYDCTEK